MSLKGLAPYQIASLLNATGQPRWSTPEQQWTPAAVSRLLSNRRTTGLLPLYTVSFRRGVAVRVPHSEVENYYPRLIKPETFLKSQDFIPDGKSRSARARFNAFALIATCSECGQSIRLVTLSSSGEYVLACQASRIHFRCTAPELSYATFMSRVRPALREWITYDFLWQTQPTNHALFRSMIEAIEKHRGAYDLNDGSTPYFEKVLRNETALEDALTLPIRGRKRLIEAASAMCEYVDNDAPTSKKTISINKLLGQLFSRVIINLQTADSVFYDEGGVELFSDKI